MNINKSIAEVEQHIRRGDLGLARLLGNKILRKAPRNVDAMFLLATVDMLDKRYAECERAFNRVLAANPRHIGAMNNLAVVALEQNRLDTAESYFQGVIRLDPAYTDALINLGNIYLKQGNLEAAEPLYRKVLTLKPDSGIAMNNLGTVLVSRGELDEAGRWMEQALRRLPENPSVYVNLGSVLLSKRDMPACIDLMNQINTLAQPGVALLFVFSVAKKIAQWDVIQNIRDDMLNVIFREHVQSNYLQLVNLEMLAEPKIGNETLFNLLEQTGADIAQLAVRNPFHDYPLAMQSLRRLRIGYLSADFREHVSTSFVRGLFNFYDKRRFEVYCYSNSSREDTKTLEYRAVVDSFTDVSKLSDWELAQRIHQDGIHILVDLSGYTSGSRIHALAYRPAPIQISYLGYPYTTGMDSIDYIVSDPYLDGPENAKYCVEKPLRLPNSFISFGELYDQQIDSMAAFERNRFVTFGTLGNVYKLNPEVISVWSDILINVPDAKLVINHPNCAMEVTRTNIDNEFARHGVSGDRLEFVWEKHPSGSHLRYYNDIDIALDSFPLTGGTTTVEAVWMGTPMITLVGETHAQRLSYSVLSNIGIDVDDLIAYSTEEYIQKAIALAKHPARLAELHQAIPEALKGSILCHPRDFTKQLEATYIEAWNGKFREPQIGLGIEDGILQWVSLGEDAKLAVSGSLHDFDSYVILEQHGWFDPEYRYVLRLLQPGMHVIDAGAGIGVYAIPMAKKIGDGGTLHAITTSESNAAYLLRSQQHNRLDNLSLVTAGLGAFCLDDQQLDQGDGTIDFIRLGSDLNDGGGSVIRRGVKVLTDHSPLVMFGIKFQNETDLSAVSALQELGYGIYRFIPGLEVLVAYSSPEELDVFAVNLFGCKPERAEQLERAGHLVSRVGPQLSSLPGIDVCAWQQYANGQPYAANLMATWTGQPATSEWRDVYGVALNLFAMAKDSRRPMADRYACLRDAHSVLSVLAQQAPVLLCLMSYARVCADLGRREMAVSLLNRLCESIEAGCDVATDMPFLALSDDFASMAAGDRIADWILASILEQREKLRVFSFFFCGEDSLDALAAQENTGFISAEMAHRKALLQARLEAIRNR